MSGTPASMGCCSRVQPCVPTPRRRDGNGHSEDSSQWQTLECFHTLLFIYLPCKVEPSVIKICVCTWKIFMKYLNAYLHLNYPIICTSLEQNINSWHFSSSLISDFQKPINYLLTIQIKTWFQNFRHKQKKQNQVIKPIAGEQL